ncbi:MAG: DEAD/DEAH box helicase [Candidatus Dasytiphilus stammeri]
MINLEKSFAELGLKLSILKSLKVMGYIKPSPIQVKCIPYLLQGYDVLGIAQTGSGKTAAFILPLLHNIKSNLKITQGLILVPTRELAIQVAEACIDFAKYIPEINILAIYGGQCYEVQLHALRKGPQIIVGTPGRLLDHIRKETLNLSGLHTFILDEADEMLRMGFIEDVEKIINKIPACKQMALFSATMPEAIRRITRNFMKKPYEVCIQTNTTTRPKIIQSYWAVHGEKSHGLLRFLETEDFDAALIFVRTKSATLEVAEFLEHSGYNKIAPLNGDMNQRLREQTLERFKTGNVDIIIATDIAARGLDVDRISLVVNYDIPIDVDSYIHRIGRTGRAGRIGKALLFVENRERKLLYNIQRRMKVEISKVNLPSTQILSERRLLKFAQKVKKQFESSDLAQYRTLLSKIQPEKVFDATTLAAVLLKIAQESNPLILAPDPILNSPHRSLNRKKSYTLNNEFKRHRINENMDLYRIELGRDDGIGIRDILEAFNKKMEFKKHKIGNIKLFSCYSTIELPKGISEKVLQHFTQSCICNKPLNIKFIGDANSLSTGVPSGKIIKVHHVNKKSQVSRRFNT